ncbi:Cof-type HAD-IIB family hydrolase [Streptococcus sciuri]|uniref:Cof-type HAD-IIB family hydrolase n=1 Tax=Streptococcus sciuri TaxID=2973939 RepID=A0ABT2F879_9STRE|nr:Cof-type HAD-IIB family hydrolase [Streptococcus sciuri]MCS4488634.1 Cof-type HAD-IIB family hydrolase [Streptococcus sciuri]
MIKLIAIDMDGTLLNSQKQIPTENIVALQQASKKGIKIVLCTGRPKSGIVPYFEQLGLTDEEYIIMNNGCSVYNTKNWDLIVSEELSYAEIKRLNRTCASYDDVYLTLTGDKSYYVLADEVPDLVQYDASLVFDTARAIDEFELKKEGEIIFQAMYMAKKASLDVFQADVDKELSQDFSTVRSQEYIYEILPQGISKASGLKQLARKLHIAPSEIMALGDAANDVEMLAFVGVSVAMGNASDDIKRRCRYTTNSNDDCGVAKAIYDYALLGR